MNKPIHLYIGAAPSEARALAEHLLGNLPAPVALHDVSELPPPGARPRQQLRKERATLQVELAKARNLLTLSEPYPRLADEVAQLRQEIAHYEARVQEIGASLDEQEGGPANG